MGKLIIQKSGGGGLDPDELTAMPGDVLKGKIAGVAGSDEPMAGTLQLSGTAADSQVLNGQTYYNTEAKTKRAGTMPNRGAWTGRIGINGSVTVPAGYHNGAGYVDQSITNRGAWTGSVAMNGRVTVPEGYHSGGGYVNGPAVTQRGAWTGSVGRNTKVAIPEGYHSGGGYVNGPSMADKGAATYTPSTSNQSISAGYYLTGTQTILGDANLQPHNIRYGVTIFGVSGTFSGQAISPYTFFNDSVNNAGGCTYIENNGHGTNIIYESVRDSIGGPTYYRYAFKVKRNSGNVDIILSGRFNNAINLTSYRYLKVSYSAGVGTFAGSVLRGVTLGVSTNSTATSFAVQTSSTSKSGTLILDVSNLNGSHFLYAKIDGNMGAMMVDGESAFLVLNSATLTDL